LGFPFKTAAFGCGFLFALFSRGKTFTGRAGGIENLGFEPPVHQERCHQGHIHALTFMDAIL
jgi:hypothetical protein